MHSLWLEIVSEPMPPSLQGWAWQKFLQSFRDVLQQDWGYTLPPIASEQENLSTPYRLVWFFEDIAETTPQRKVEHKGPKADAPDTALAGFLKKHSISKEQCTLEETAKGKFWYYRHAVGGEKMEDVLGKAIVAAIARMKWPKVMRFAYESPLWIRPLQRLVAVFDGNALSGGMDCLTKEWRASSHHEESFLPFMDSTWDDMLQISSCDKAHTVAMTSLEDYESMGVYLQPQKRAQQLSLQIEESNEAWCAQMALLLERGFLLPCHIQNHFLNLPDEVIETALLDHMKVWVSCIERDNIHFYAAIETRKDGKQNQVFIQDGYERVAIARLRDADFFWQEDAKISLADRLPLLRRQIWHKGLQSMEDKARRLEALAGKIAALLSQDIETIALAKRAGLLSKSDLSTHMVSEYASLQGLIGGFYAKRDGEHESVASAITGHYREERLDHKDNVCLALFIADRIDTLAGMWKSGNIPTGSRDPFALRRATKELAHVLFSHQLPISFATILTQAADIWQCDPKDWQEDLTSYYHQRLLESIVSSSFEKTALAVILARDPKATLTVESLKKQLHALSRLHEQGQLALLAQMYRRIIGFLGENIEIGHYDPSLTKNPQEKSFADSVAKIVKSLGKQESNMLAYASTILESKPYFDAFCEQVRVVDPENEVQSKNRMLLLESLRHLFHSIGDFDAFVRYYSKKEEA